MIRKSFYILSAVFLFSTGCSEVPQPEETVRLTEIPKDRMAIYLIEGISDKMMYHELPVDSIRLFGERLVEYHEIVGYDTVYFAFSLLESAINRLSTINIEYMKWCLPFAVVCEGEVIFGAYLYHPKSLFFPYWYYATATRQDKFTIYAPVWTSHPFESEPRKDPRMIRVLVEDDKIKEPEFIR
ncbi:MAG: hypothetical protein KFF73_19385 [Cyclobacteriaceae bacterium]|nr:hypothetical protein [Cyclobacteriaceae bacterium]